MSLPYDKYASGEYFENNPEWDQGDSPWKAKQVLDLLRDFPAPRHTVVEVGCGAGKILAELAERLPDASFDGFDIAPDAARFWSQYSSERIRFTGGDFLLGSQPPYDLLLLLDVIEHVADPLDFLNRLRPRAREFIFHIPLDLSAFSVARETPLLRVREQVGHIHYYTKNLALRLLDECGYEVVHWRYTGATFTAPGRGLGNRIMNIGRRAVRLLGRDFGVRLLGGETLLVLARSKPST